MVQQDIEQNVIAGAKTAAVIAKDFIDHRNDFTRWSRPDARVHEGVEYLTYEDAAQWLCGRTGNAINAPILLMVAGASDSNKAWPHLIEALIDQHPRVLESVADLFDLDIGME